MNSDLMNSDLMIIGQCLDRRASLQSLQLGLCAWVALMLAGCGGSAIAKRYGALDYPEKVTSINGLGVFEKLCVQSGLRTINVQRLSPRLKRAQTLILVGDTFHPPAKEARDWIEKWLAEKSGRTVLYFGRDFTAESYVYAKTLDKQPADKLSRAQFELARSRALLDIQYYREVGSDVFCRWFVLRGAGATRQFKVFQGPLANMMGDQGVWPVRTYLDTPDIESRDQTPKWNTTVTTMTPVGPVPVPRRQSSRNKQNQPEATTYTSWWSYTDINDDETWSSEWDKVGECEVLLAAQDGTPLVTELTSESFSGSRILLLANGAPLLNGTLVEPHFMQLASHLVSRFDPAGRVAFLSYTSGGIQVSEVPDDENEVAGLSVLVTWPLNIFMAHLALLGILICLALFPIHGRPQDLPAHSVTDFGQHAEALGQMLSRTGDIHYAVQVTTDYLRQVRGETPPNWLQSTTTSPATPANSTSTDQTL